jgi:hypothetical protein
MPYPYTCHTVRSQVPWRYALLYSTEIYLSFMEGYVPSHPDLFEVEFRSGDYRSALISRKVRH